MGVVRPYFDLWAKAEVSGCRWHSLPFHLLDVGAVAASLLEVLPRPSLNSVVEAFKSPDDARRALVFLAAAHDIGKANPYFQRKHDGRRSGMPAKWGLRAFNDQRDPLHGHATMAFLFRWLEKRWSWPQPLRYRTSNAVGGHHGVFFCNTEFPIAGGSKIWDETASVLLDDLWNTVSEISKPPEPPLDPDKFISWLAGFVSVADWLGSHDLMNLWRSEPEDLSLYWRDALLRASEALPKLQWTPTKEGVRMEVHELLPQGCQPNALQSVAHDIARVDFTLTIIEAPTGEGKTEAAFTMAESIRHKGGGIYFALPTMATANGLFTRVENYLQKAVGDEDAVVRLLHSDAWLYRQERRRLESESDEALDPGMEDWFDGSKRGLLAPYGVGTIDQILMGSLVVRHGFVRLFALAGKVVVIDEVHAYDAYMSELLGILLSWLRILNCKVILLSATLPSEMRLSLLASWGCATEPIGSYPSITWVDRNGDSETREFVAAPGKPLKMELIEQDMDSIAQLGARKILSLVEESGGCGALVLNTVRDAQEAYLWLKTNAPCVDLTLFHARYRKSDRNQIEKEVLRKFGKGREATLPSILVATQVVEQSLDLDFDHMVSDLAPIDLLIQRAGRLHRHSRSAQGMYLGPPHPDERGPKTLHVLGSPRATGSGNTSKYNVYVASVLCRTEQYIADHSTFMEPKSCADAVEAVYSKGLIHELSEKTTEAIRREVEKTAQHRQRAEQVAIPRAGSGTCLTRSRLILDERVLDENSVLTPRTRLNELPSTTVVVVLSNEARDFAAHQPIDKAKLAHATVQLSGPHPLINAVRQLPPPDCCCNTWRMRRKFEHLHALVLDECNAVRVGRFQLTYQTDLGLQWEKVNE
ncbi:MAG: CRISPR-associated helicase Cas3' [Armatimonadetes bacterium]|nr:CRISPR-associated helicase Cas3' [Armatimonadota bacterium]